MMELSDTNTVAAQLLVELELYAPTEALVDHSTEKIVVDVNDQVFTHLHTSIPKCGHQQPVPH